MQWIWEDPAHVAGNDGVFVRLGVDVYNAGDNRPDQNLLQWKSAPDGWEFSPWPQPISALQTYGVQRFSMTARVNLQQIVPSNEKPVEISFIDGYTHNDFRAKAMLPIATSDRRSSKLVIDGKLNDWNSADLLANGKLVKMLDRPSVQRRPAGAGPVAGQSLLRLGR